MITVLAVLPREGRRLLTLVSDGTRLQRQRCAIWRLSGHPPPNNPPVNLNTGVKLCIQCL